MFYFFCSIGTLPCVAVPAWNLLQLPSRCIHLLQNGVLHGLQGLPASLWCSPWAKKEILLHCVLQTTQASGTCSTFSPSCVTDLCVCRIFFSHFSHSSASHLLCCAFTFFQICYHTGTTSFTDVFCFWLEAGLIWSWLKWFFIAQEQPLVSTLPLTCKWNTGTPSWAADTSNKIKQLGIIAWKQNKKTTEVCKCPPQSSKLCWLYQCEKQELK